MCTWVISLVTVGKIDEVENNNFSFNKNTVWTLFFKNTGQRT